MPREGEVQHRGAEGATLSDEAGHLRCAAADFDEVIDHSKLSRRISQIDGGAVAAPDVLVLAVELVGRGGVHAQRLELLRDGRIEACVSADLVRSKPGLLRDRRFELRHRDRSMVGGSVQRPHLRRHFSAEVRESQGGGERTEQQVVGHSAWLDPKPRRTREGAESMYLLEERHQRAAEHEERGVGASEDAREARRQACEAGGPQGADRKRDTTLQRRRDQDGAAAAPALGSNQLGANADALRELELILLDRAMQVRLRIPAVCAHGPRPGQGQAWRERSSARRRAPSDHEPVVDA